MDPSVIEFFTLVRAVLLNFGILDEIQMLIGALVVIAAVSFVIKALIG